MRQRKIITKDNIYIVQQFAYVHKVAEISLFIGKKIQDLAWANRLKPLLHGLSLRKNPLKFIALLFWVKS